MSAHCCIKLDLFINIDSWCKEPWVKKNSSNSSAEMWKVVLHDLCFRLCALIPACRTPIGWRLRHSMALYYSLVVASLVGFSLWTAFEMWWHAQKPDFAFRRNGRVHLNRRGSQFSRLLAGEPYTSACRVRTARASLCSTVMWRLLVTHSILLVPLLYPCVTVCHHISNAVYLA